MAYQPSVQLYSLRDAVDESMDASLARVSAIGYSIVEPYAFVERADALKEAMGKYGLSAPSAHNGVIDSDDPSKIFDVAADLGIRTVIDPFIPTERWQTAEDVKKLADRANELAPIAAKSGVEFGYHNHQWELVNKIDGRHALEVFAERLDPAVVLEVDTFWATVGGADAPELLRRLGDRVRFIHVKDGVVSGAIADELPSSESALKVSDVLAQAYKQQKPAGQGDVDVRAILDAAPDAVRVVEFDDYEGDIFEGIAQSLTWLREHDPQAHSAKAEEIAGNHKQGIK